MRTRLHTIASGERGTDQTLRIMGNLIESSNQQPRIRLLALNILARAHVPPKDDRAAAMALYDWIKSNIAYVKDPVNMESVQCPGVTAFEIKAGDCDDHSALMAALAQSVGIPAKLTVIGNTPENFLHIYPEINIKGRWIAADTTIKEPFGTRPRLPIKKRYNVNGVPIVNLGLAPVQVIPVTKETAKKVAYSAALDVLKSNWNRGLINAADVRGYLRVIDEGNADFRGTIYQAPMRKAISDFLAHIENTGAQSSKPIQNLSGLEGLDGFLKSVWNGVKSAVGSVVNTGIKLATGAVGTVVGAVASAVTGGSQTAQQTFEQQTTPQPQYVQAAAVPSGDNTMIYMAVAGIAAILLLKGK